MIDRALTWVAETIVSMAGFGFNPDSCPLPAFPNVKPPTAKVPKKEKPKEERGDWVAWDGGKVFGTAENTVDLDDYADYGLTEREYGEMLAYNPPLRNLELAGKVKKWKMQGKTIKEMADISRESQSLLKHYSAALSRAKI